MIGAALDAWHFVTGFPNFVGNLSWPTIIVSMALGMILGAQLRWPGVIAILTLGVGMFFMFRERAAEDHPHEHVGGEDASPPVKPRVRRDSIAKRLGIGE